MSDKLSAHTAARMPVEIYVDGGLFGRNPSPRGIYWSIVVVPRPDVPAATIREQDKSGRYQTNDEAEWLALREGFRWAVEHTPTLPVTVYSDSRAVVDCYNQKKRIKLERRLRLYYECKRLADQLPFVVVQWVPREVSLAKLGH